MNLEHCRETISAMQNLAQGFRERACDGLALEVGIEFNILNLASESNNCQRQVVLIGESHKSEPIRRNETYQLARAFPVRLIEGIWDMEHLENPGLLDEIASENSNNRGVSIEEALVLNDPRNRPGWWLWETPVPRGSPFQDMLEDSGIHIGYGNEGFGYQYHVDDYATASIYRDALDTMERFTTIGDHNCSTFGIGQTFTNQTNPTEFLRAYSELIGTEGFPPINISAESGRLDHYNYDCRESTRRPECMAFIQTDRNQRMVANLLRTAEALPCNIPLMLIVGRNHLHPITRILTGEHGASLHDEALSGYSYNTNHSDPAFQNEPSDE